MIILIHSKLRNMVPFPVPSPTRRGEMDRSHYMACRSRAETSLAESAENKSKVACRSQAETRV